MKTFSTEGRPLGHLPGIVVSVVCAEHHAVVNGHGAVFSKELQGSFQETVTSVTRVTINGEHIAGCLRLDGELAVLGMDLKMKRKFWSCN